MRGAMLPADMLTMILEEITAAAILFVSSHKSILQKAIPTVNTKLFLQVFRFRHVRELYGGDPYAKEYLLKSVNNGLQHNTMSHTMQCFL